MSCFFVASKLAYIKVVDLDVYMVQTIDFSKLLKSSKRHVIVI